MAKALVERNSFAAGEISPALYARRELGMHAIGVARCDNLVALIEGALTRRPGTRFVLPYKTESQGAYAIRFRYTTTDGYLLVLNGGTMRVLKDGGFLESPPGTVYELAIPWAAADLPNIRYQQVETQIYITCTGYQTRVLTRIGHTNWTLTLYQPQGGPVGTQNINQAITIQASATSGNGITLTGIGTSFSANDIGGVFRLDEPDLTKVPAWTPNEIIQAPQTMIGAGAGAHIGDMTSGNGINAAFDGVTNSDANASPPSTVTQCYIGQNYGGSPQKIAKIVIYGSNVTGFWSGSNHTLEFRLYGKNGSAPANSTDGTELGRITFTDTDNESAGRTIFSIDTVTAWQYVWVNLRAAQAPSIMKCVELQLFTWTSPTPANQRRYNGRVYAALNDGDSGPNPPTHEEGDVRSGNFNITWRFLHNTYGMARITAVASATSATADVILRLPDSVVSGATYRWWPPAWSPGAGWPDRIGAHDGRLVFGRKHEFWITRPSDINSLEVLNIFGDAADADSAIAAALRPRKSALPWIEWIISAGVVILGLRDAETILRAPQLFDPLTVDKMRAIPGSKEGSAAHDPADVDDGVIFIGRSRRRLHYADFDNLTAKMTALEITKSARHILSGGAASLAWQRDPNRILWIACQDGSLRAVTFMPEDKVVAFSRHTMTNGFVEWVASIPTADEKTDEVYIGVRRTINGATRRYVERLQEFFIPLNTEAPTAAGAWFVDSGLGITLPTVAINTIVRSNPVHIVAVGHQFTNGDSVKITGVQGMVEINDLVATVANAVTNEFDLAGIDATGFTGYTGGGIAAKVYNGVSGLTHLIGQTVRVFADGAQQSDKVVSGGGTVALDAYANTITIGLPITFFVRSLPFDVEMPGGVSKGKAKGASHVVIETVYSAGGTLAIHPGEIGVNAGKKEPIVGTGSLDYDAAIPLLTELKRIPVSSKKGPRCFVELEGDNALPFTLAGLHPELEVEG